VRIPNYSRVPHLVNRVSYISDRRIEKRGAKEGGEREGASSLCRNAFVQLSIPRRCVRARARDNKETFISQEDLIIQHNAPSMPRLWRVYGVFQRKPLFRGIFYSAASVSAYIGDVNHARKHELSRARLPCWPSARLFSASGRASERAYSRESPKRQPRAGSRWVTESTRGDTNAGRRTNEKAMKRRRRTEATREKREKERGEERVSHRVLFLSA